MRYICSGRSREGLAKNETSLGSTCGFGVRWDALDNITVNSLVLVYYDLRVRRITFLQTNVLR